MPSDDLTLWDLSTGLVEVLAAREEAETPEEQSAADTAIAAYVAALPTKVDSIANAVRAWRANIAERKAEAKRIRAGADVLERRVERLLDFVKACMSVLGKTRIEGKLNNLVIRGNGGKQPVDVQGWDKDRERWINGDPGLLPAELCWAMIKMPFNVWEALVDQVTDERRTLNAAVIDVERTPRLSAIAEALAQPCIRCHGTDDPESCPTCRGSGTHGVPGATLLPRGNSVIVK